MKKIAAIFAHPDDEILGCGATLAKYSDLGFPVHILILTKGVTSRKVRDYKKSQAKLIYQAKKAAEVIGASSISFENFPDNKMDSVPLLDIVKKVEHFIDKNEVEKIFTHDSNDLNNDHILTNKTVITACRPFVRNIEIYTCEILSSTAQDLNPEKYFKPNFFVDIKDYLEKKIEAIKKYEMELKKWPHPRSVECINYKAKLRGAESGLESAEAFKCLIKVLKKEDLP